MNSTDLILVERSSALYKETFSNRANVDATDLLIVERGTTLHKCTYSDWAAALGGGGGGGGTGTHGWAASNNTYNITTSYTSVSGDSTAAFNYFSQAMSVTGGTGTATGNLYIGIRIRGATAYYHDFCLSHVQVITSAGNAFRTDSTYGEYDWNFHNTGNSNGHGAWQRCQSSLSSQTPSVDPSTLTYGTILTSAANNYWTRGTSTGSTYTGAADGTYNPTTYSGGGGSILSGSVSQASGTYYLYTETSGSGYTIGTTTMWLKSPSMTISNGDYLRLSYLAVGGSSSTNGLGFSGNSVLYFRFK